MNSAVDMEITYWLVLAMAMTMAILLLMEISLF
jgi:hypothetical protein